MDPETAIAIFGILAVIGLIALAMAFPLVGIIIATVGVALFVARYIYIRWIRDRRSPPESSGEEPPDWQ
jgi:threonine/homoserine/homoserine lactone efflux protein